MVPEASIRAVSRIGSQMSPRTDLGSGRVVAHTAQRCSLLRKAAASRPIRLLGAAMNWCILAADLAAPHVQRPVLSPSRPSLWAQTDMGPRCYGSAMRLTEVEISGYKRLAATQKMDLDGHLICIVGPNGAGKSSFLDALVHLTDSKDFVRDEMTRAEQGSVLSVVLQASYVLEEEDLQTLSGVPEASGASVLHVTKTAANGFSSQVQPTPVRNVDLRERAKKRLNEFLSSKWLESAAPLEAEADTPIEPTTTELAQQALAAASSDVEDLTEDQIASFGGIRDRLHAVRDGEHISEAGDLAEKYAKLPEDLDKLMRARRPLTLIKLRSMRCSGVGRALSNSIGRSRTPAPI